MLAFGHRLTAADGIDRGPPPSPFASNSSTAIFVPTFCPSPDLRGFPPPSTPVHQNPNPNITRSGQLVPAAPIAGHGLRRPDQSGRLRQAGQLHGNMSTL